MRSVVKAISIVLCALWPRLVFSAPDSNNAADAGAAQAPANSSGAAQAPANPSGTAPTNAPTVAARQHFQTGLELYKDGNFDGARAEFEASYALKPGAASLQNIALCLKARFRYVEALDTLKRLLDVHGASLSPTDKQDVESAVTELNGVIGTLTIELTPADATLTLDGAPVSAAQLKNGIRVNVGEHTLFAKASGYDSAREVTRVAGGQTSKIQIALKPWAGFLEIVTEDPDAAIAIDGVGKSFQRWSGPVNPGRHVVQVYKNGYEPFEDVVNVELGQHVSMPAQLGPRDDGDSSEISVTSKTRNVPAPPPLAQRGFYALGVLSAIGLDEAPQDLNIDQAKTTAGGVLGVRAGYRVWTPVGAEFVLEGGEHTVTGACQVDPTTQTCPAGAPSRNYKLNSLRFGGAVRLMSSGTRLRFTSSLGVGAVRHKLSLDAVRDSSGTVLLSGGTAEGFDPFFLAELGAQYNVGHVLFELDLVVVLDGATFRGNLDGHGDKKVFGDNPGALPMLGAGLRVGWGEWKP